MKYIVPITLASLISVVPLCSQEIKDTPLENSQLASMIRRKEEYKQTLASPTSKFYEELPMVTEEGEDDKAEDASPGLVPIISTLADEEDSDPEEVFEPRSPAQEVILK